MKKQRNKIIHIPTTYEIFICLSAMPIYSKILLINEDEQPYTNFLKWLIEKDFYNDRKSKKITIQKIATEYQTNSTKVTKWIKQIYKQIIELNSEKPELFQENQIKVCMIIQHFDNLCFFYLFLPVLPREYETISIPFLRAKLGTSTFWVKQVEYEVDKNKISINLTLDGASLNKYRELSIDKALFQEKIGIMDLYYKHSFELDSILNKLYRN